MAYESNSIHIPNFVSAGSPQGLRRAMLKNNTKKGMVHRYFDIQFVNGKWIAWFLDTVVDAKDIQEMSSDLKK